ncbi:hypothetical protein [Geminocystis herdmanii]|nr:hypothetical protein [Geminocystis herdmanii]
MIYLDYFVSILTYFSDRTLHPPSTIEPLTISTLLHQLDRTVNHINITT